MKFEINLDRLHELKHKKCVCRLEDTPENQCPCDDMTKNGKCICGIFK